MPDLLRRCVRPACLVLVPLAAASVFGAVPTKQAGRDLGYNALGAPALTPAEQLRTFTVPTGFEVELVAAEGDGIGKFITVDWDARGRLWTMTAFEYPVDANENAAASAALFARGGRDRVLVYDAPYGAPSAPGAAAAGPPRVFADSLVMPLGLLPWRDGALVQYGADIRHYRDSDRDGRADRHETILTGFGTHDSHLFPHQFHRQPGGWILLAQGLFNYSTVRRPGDAAFADGTTGIPFDQCKLGRFTADGARFEALTAGPNNIWGLVTARTGEVFLQEANDMGYPIIPYAPGIHVRTGSRDKLRPYQPLMPPPLERPQMGGTGLSGLALAEDRDGHFRRPAAVAADGSDRALVFYLANPITSTIQLVRAVPDGTRYRYEKLPDFLTATDRSFRPIAIHFGPDGALYIVDWYNRIISHNEVPREHPDRDKSRGRIWRVRHRDQPRTPPPDLTRLDTPGLLARLGDTNALVSRLAWLELTDRGDSSVAPALERIVTERTTPTDRRLAALWALEGLAPVGTPLLRALATESTPALRREAARLSAAQARPENERVAVLESLVADPHPAVRAAVGDALRRAADTGPATLALAARLGAAPLATSDVWMNYEREFERYLARWAFETFPAATRALLGSAAGRALPAENRLLAVLALGGREGAVGVAALAPTLGRPLDENELAALVGHLDEPAVRTLLTAQLASGGAHAPTLRALLTLRTAFDAAQLRPALAGAVAALLAGTAPAEQQLGAEAAGAFRLGEAEAALNQVLRAGLAGDPPKLSAPALAALRALGETGGGDVALCADLATRTKEAAARDAALQALGTARDPTAPGRLVALLGQLPATPRGRALDRLTRTPAGARALMAGRAAGQVPAADFGIATVDRLRAVLPDDPAVNAWWRELGGDAATSDTLPALTPAEAAAEAERLTRFRALANVRGNPEHGRTLFTALCLNCHQQAGQGGQIGPPLDGVGHTGVDAILRNVLTPSAAMEGAYRTYRVSLRDGTVQEGFLASETPDALVLRVPGATEQHIPRAAVRESGYLRRSLMPEGLLDALPPEHVSDLFAFLKMLR